MQTVCILLVTLVSLFFNFGSCDTDYCSLESEKCLKHIGCSRYVPTSSTKKVKISEFSEESKAKLIHFTNEVRNKIANATYSNGVRGANVPLTVWSSELDYFAKRFLQFSADENPYHYCFKLENVGYIQDVRIVSVNSTNTNGIVDALIEQESNYVPEKSITQIRLSHWKYVGCAVKFYYEEKIKYLPEVVCMHGYDVEENRIKTYYEEGVPCSKCDSGLGCDSVFTSLCKH